MSRQNNKKTWQIGMILFVCFTLGYGGLQYQLKQINATQNIMDQDVQEVSSLKELPKEVIPGGNLVGVKITTDGVYVIGTSEVETPEGIENPCYNKIQKGDQIYAVNEERITSKETLRSAIENNGDQRIKIKVKAEGQVKEVIIDPAYSKEAAKYKLGLWVKDGTQGIGTLTYIDPDSQEFGALGHGITDSDTKKLLPIKNGQITTAQITSITKGQKGEPGQLSGTIHYTTMGEVGLNTSIGIYGKINPESISKFNTAAIPIAYQEEIHEGEATILTSLTNTMPKEYKILIQKVARYNSEPSKSMIIKIIDEALLKQTNGIVQGMSGSPIIQDGKLIGAITHVFIQDPTKGYGIFIENMLNNKIK